MSECGGRGRQITVNALIVCYVWFIMCNVAALTFYATIYEDICCICNKSREKHVLGTASTAGSLCLFDLWVFRLPGQVRGHNLQSLRFDQKIIIIII